MSTTFNVLDLVFAGFALIFVATAFFRGFVKEIFALIAWLLAFVGSYLLTPLVVDYFNIYSHNKMVADVSARSVIFIIIFLGFTFSTSSLVDEFREKIPHSFDRSLGVFYGLIKTLIVFGVIYSVAINALGFLAGKPVAEDSPQFPAFMKEAKCHDLLKGSADFLNPAVKLFFDAVVENFDDVIPQQKDDLGEKINEVIKDKKKLDKPDSTNLDGVSESIEKDSGYSKKDIEKMNHLIDIIEK